MAAAEREFTQNHQQFCTHRLIYSLDNQAAKGEKLVANLPLLADGRDE